MDFILSCVLFLSALIFSITHGIHILLPFSLGLFCFSCVGIYRGFSPECVLKMIGGGMARVIIVLRVFLMLGIITAVWRACGTIPFFVYYGISLIDARFFILFVFILTCLASLIIGSSSGTVGTIGIVLMIIARSGGADLSVTAGAIIAGVYVGDRTAPTSSTANLIAALTKTNIIDNFKNMIRSALVPIIISLIIYLALSFCYGMDKTDSNMLSEISANFNIGLITAIPALVMVILPILRFSVLVSMLISAISGILIAVFVQGLGLYELFIYMLAGYELETSDQFAMIISGGGIVSMMSIMGILLLSSGYSGIFEGTGVLKDVIAFLKSSSRKIAVYPLTLLAALFTAAFGCNQIVSIILTYQLMREIYHESGKNNSSLALDLSDSSVVVSPLIPWNTAFFVQMMMLSAGVGCIPYAVFLYILPIYRIFFDYPVQRRLS